MKLNNDNMAFFISFIKKIERSAKTEISMDLYNNPMMPKKNVIYARIDNPNGRENMKFSMNESNLMLINLKTFCPNINEINVTKIK